MNGKLVLILGLVLLLSVGVVNVSRHALLPSEGRGGEVNKFKPSFPKPREASNLYQAVTKSSGVRLSAAQNSLSAGASLPVTVYFNSQGVPIIGVALRISFQGTDIAATKPVADSGLLTGGDWACPIRSTAAVGGVVNVDFACLNTSTTGFVSSGEMPLLTFNLSASSNVTPRTLLLALDPDLSVMTRKSDANNILNPDAKLSINVAK